MVALHGLGPANLHEGAVDLLSQRTIDLLPRALCCSQREDIKQASCISADEWPSAEDQSVVQIVNASHFAEISTLCLARAYQLSTNIAKEGVLAFVLATMPMRRIYHLASSECIWPQAGEQGASSIWYF